MNLPMTRFERWMLLLLRKPVLWAAMVCTGGATLAMVRGMAQSHMPGSPKTTATKRAPAISEASEPLTCNEPH